MDQHIHCSVCDFAALFSVRRFKKIGWELLCECHFEWLQDNTRRGFEVRRVAHPCDCIRATRVLRPEPATIEELDSIVGEAGDEELQMAQENEAALV